MMIQEFLPTLIGLPFKQAEEKINQTEIYYCRVVSVDGKPFGITDDFRQDRISLHVENDKVTQAYAG